MKGPGGTKEAAGSGVATEQAENATAAPGPTAIQAGPVILNLSLPLLLQ